LTGSAPEPSTWAMMALGFAGLAFAGYRRSRKDSEFAA
jgi:PEP-CTERM motif